MNYLLFVNHNYSLDTVSYVEKSIEFSNSGTVKLLFDQKCEKELQCRIIEFFEEAEIKILGIQEI